MVSFVRANMRDAFDNIQTFGTNTKSIKDDATPEIDSKSLVDEIIEKFAQSFSKGSKPDDKITQEAKFILDSADKDKNGTVSVDELKNFDSSALDVQTRMKLNEVEDNFKLYDINQDGELSLDEIKNAISKKQYSLQELKAMANEDNAENKDNLMSNGLSNSFFQKAIDNYKKESVAKV